MVAHQFHKILTIAILCLFEKLQLCAFQDIVLDLVDGALLHNGVELYLVLGGVVLDMLHFVGNCVHIVVDGDGTIAGMGRS